MWDGGARPSLRGALLKICIQNLDPRKKTELAGDCNGGSSGDGNGNDEGMSNSDFLKQVREGNMLVATLIATVTFTAAFTVPGGFNQNGTVGEGLAVLSKITAFQVFLIANTLAFGLSATSVFVHFLALTTSEEIAFHTKIERRTAFYTNWSIGAMLVAFIAGTYTVVPHSLGIAVAVLLTCCFVSSLFLPVTIKDCCKYYP